MLARKRMIWGIALVIVLAAAAAGGWLWWKKNGTHGTAKQEALTPVKSVSAVKDSYDVIVTGTDPEGIAAAVSAPATG
ncbi:hypothetical protein LJK88_27800 [Paenibacillus sp. P26]|nr:hypothetical protein LJK88_27800 [Paenibacillus sp. P26]